MIKIYDKAKWHIDGGEDSKEVIRRFEVMLGFLDMQGFLTDEGKEILEIGIDSEISLTERMLTKEGNIFIGENCDKLLETSSKELEGIMNQLLRTE